MFRVIRELHPKWVLGENVTGIDDGSLDKICSDLEKENYKITGILEMPACLFGALHERYGTAIIAHIKGKPRIQTNSATVSARSCREAWTNALREIGRLIPESHWETYKPPIPRVDDGIPIRLDEYKARCMTLGNAVVPQQFYPILQAIAEIETEIF